MKSIPGLVFFPEPYEFELERREIKNNFDDEVRNIIDLELTNECSL